MVEWGAHLGRGESGPERERGVGETVEGEAESDEMEIKVHGSHVMQALGGREEVIVSTWAESCSIMAGHSSS